MITKTFEIRDRATYIPILAIKLEPGNESDRYLLARAGFGLAPTDQAKYIQVVRIEGGGGQSHCDPNHWGVTPRTMRHAHIHLLDRFDTLESGDVIDVEYILGETQEPKQSERLRST